MRSRREYGDLMESIAGSYFRPARCAITAARLSRGTALMLILKIAGGRKRSFGEVKAKVANQLRLVVDTIPTLAWVVRRDGSAEFFNRRWLDYTGLSREQAVDWGFLVAAKPICSRPKS